MPKLSAKFTSERPWAWLRMSRKQYEKLRPWKKCNLSRAAFERIALNIPQDLIEEMRDHATAEMLVEAIFKQSEADSEQ